MAACLYRVTGFIRAAAALMNFRASVSASI
jgi:hypothetical protein